MDTTTIDVLVRMHPNGAGQRELVLNIPSVYQGEPSQLVLPLEIARQMVTDAADAVEAADLLTAARNEDDR